MEGWELRGGARWWQRMRTCARHGEEDGSGDHTGVLEGGDGILYLRKIQTVNRKKKKH
jgi:hypothetical protein